MWATIIFCLVKIKIKKFFEQILESQTNFRLTSLNPNVFCATMSKNKIKKFQGCAEFGFERIYFEMERANDRKFNSLATLWWMRVN